MKKFRIFFDIEKEEQWLNEQLHKGYYCTKVSGWGVYTFEKTLKNYVIRLDYRDHLSKEKFEEYKEIYEDFGWSCIKGPWMSGIRYWQKEDDGQNEIFSDRESKRCYYKRLMNYSFALLLLFLMLSYSTFRDSGLYMTQGLWSMKGSLFWKAFIFETPFALIRLFPPIMAILFGCSYYKTYQKYSLLKEE
ncbi:DUF2812 domain-containing protein [Aciduricibacillus chroicocephali]|uniref:DUF2812 domain-containing protein n=1 Tax=Aciduricibacillus chroicocephali TaxID=3054939 RepID=A0ABY9KWC7_9BACI|nr:DUF2812 domain-containing protein [Bacillaceae bacterium 44XB]